MNSAEFVTTLIANEKNQGIPLTDVAWNAALACVGWAYVFGARGEYCTPANRRARYKDAYPSIKDNCKNYYGSSSEKCSGCKWFPNDKLTRFFDCRGFTYWVLKKVYDWELVGSGATSQWDTASNWKAKGEIKDIPDDVLVCLFVRKGNKMEHTGFGYKGETVECSSGVQHFAKRNKKWTHWAIPACIDKEPEPGPDPSKRPTLRRGDKGPYVTLAQTELLNKGYSLDPFGVDGSFGKVTENAVKSFQKDHGLVQDGVIGPRTWEALDAAEPVKLYKVIIPGLTATEADSIVAKYPGSYKEEEKR